MTYSPVCKNTTIRMFFALCAYYNMEVYGSDLDQAFLQVTRKRPVYCIVPKNFKDENGNLVNPNEYVLKVIKNLYGFDEAPKGLFDFMCDKLLALGFTRSDHDPGLFYRIGKGEFTLVTLYVDDVNIGSTKEGAAAQVITDLKGMGVELSLEKNPKRYVGYRIKYHDNGDISLDTQDYCAKLIEKYKAENLKERALPANPAVSSKMLEKDCVSRPINQINVSKGRKICGEVLYEAMKCSPEICPAVNRLCTTAARPSDLWFEQAMWLVGYLKGRQRLNPRIVYKRRKPGQPLVPQVTGLSDSSFNTTLNGRSMLGWFVMLNCSLISYHTGLSKVVTLSTTEAEAHALSDLCKEILYLIMLLGQLGMDIRPVELGVDNMGCLKNAHGGMARRTQHAHYRICHVREILRDKLATLRHVSGLINISDIMSKAMRSVQQFDLLRRYVFTLDADGQYEAGSY
jgi:hypothetical protein